MIATRLLIPISGRIKSVSGPSDSYSRITIWVAAGAVVTAIAAKNPAARGETPKLMEPRPTSSAVAPISRALMRQSFAPMRRMAGRLKLPPMVNTISPRMMS